MRAFAAVGCLSYLPTAHISQTGHIHIVTTFWSQQRAIDQAPSVSSYRQHYHHSSVLGGCTSFGRRKQKSEADTFSPNIAGWTLPPPSADPAIMEDIEIRENKLSTLFNTQLADLVYHIYQTIKVKSSPSTEQQMDREMLASLMDHLVKAVNDPSTFHNRENTWQHAVITKRIDDIIQAMVAGLHYLKPCTRKIRLGQLKQSYALTSNKCRHKYR